MATSQGNVMLTHEQVFQAVVKAIEIVGLESFKQTSMFMRNNRVELVIGSMYAPALTKKGLAELIAILQDVHDAMK